jgi:hypothetical protein
MRLAVGLVLLAALASPAAAQQTTTTQQPAAAQPPLPIQHNDLLPPFVIDVRGAIAQLGEDATTAGDLNLTTAQLPTTGIGGAVAVNVYPLRRKKMSLGIGGEGLLSRATSNGADATGAITGPRVERRFEGISGTFSLNFGHRQGWSYVSVGGGPLRFQTFAGDVPFEAAPFEFTPNFGVGARWFTNEHIAFCFDLRFYQTQPVDATATSPGRGRVRVLVISAGISIK